MPCIILTTCIFGNSLQAALVNVLNIVFKEKKQQKYLLTDLENIAAF